MGALVAASIEVSVLEGAEKSKLAVFSRAPLRLLSRSNSRAQFLPPSRRMDSVDMGHAQKRKQQATVLRALRRLHRITGTFLFAFFLLMGITGLLLGWKKHSGGKILPKSYHGTSTDMTEWLPISVLHERATAIARASIGPQYPLDLERIDVRPDKGMVKFVFLEGYWGIQLDCATGNLLHIERRRSDFIENLHDGSIVDYLLGTKNEGFKLVYTSVMALSLMALSLSGFWLWIGPRLMRKRTVQSNEMVAQEAADGSRRQLDVTA